ncbi:hypothetical protein BDZ97DRAFT_1978119, partial [Flammula alnicola]
GRRGIGNIRQASVPRRPAQLRPRRFLRHPSQRTRNANHIGFLNRIQPEVDAAEQEIIREYATSHSSGGGGIGNMNRSRSRDLTSTPKLSTGRSRWPWQSWQYHTRRRQCRGIHGR